jgi:predicted  nucleic acid-binding Zn-ribbon protein
MTHRRRAARWGRMIVVMAAFAAPTAPAAADSSEPSPSPDPSRVALEALLEQGISQLSLSIEGIAKRMADSGRQPEGSDTTLRELRRLDMAAWQLRQEQWKLQREHLLFARDRLAAAQSEPATKPQLLEQWLKHEESYLADLENLRQRRLGLERQRYQVEADLVQRHLR